MPNLDSSQHNTKVELPSIGLVELKYVSGGDFVDYGEMLAEKGANKTLTQKILHHQLIRPKLSFEDFQKLPDKELQILAGAFVKNEVTLFEHYQSSGDVYTDFVTALKTHQEQGAQETLKTIQPMIDSAQKAITNFGLRYESVIGESLKNAARMGDLLKGVNRLGSGVTRAMETAQAIKPIVDQYNSFATSLAKSLSPQIEIWKKWAERESIFESTTKVWIEFQNRYKIAKKDAANVLRKYKWFISPSTPITLIFEVQKLDKKPGRQDRAVNRLFIDYFEANNWQALEAMANGWASSPFLKSRYKIIKDCVLSVKSGSQAGVNVSNVVVPTLIVQIDGILYDYMDAKGLGHPGYNSRNTVLKGNPLPVSLPTELDDVATEVFLNVLFQTSGHGVPLANPFNFNRHKILHAENKAYGRKDYLVRAFMVLDMLASLR